MSRTVRVVLSLLVLATVGGPAGTHAAPPAGEPVPVTVQNTPLPVIAAERAGLVVQGTVAAGQSGQWTVGLAPGTTLNLPARRVFRMLLESATGTTFLNETDSLVVIDRISAEFFRPSDVTWTELTVTVDDYPVTGNYEDHVAFFGQGGHFSDPFRRFTVHAMTQLYVLPGQQLRLHARDNGGSSSVPEVFLSGHYEPMAQP